MLKCDYCGRENADEILTCPGCGTPLARGAQTAADGLQTSSKGSAGAALDLALGVAGILAGHGFGFVHLMRGVLHPNRTEDPNSPHSLLEAAARLESVDLRAAIVCYEEIIERHSGTAAAKEASRNIETLKAANPGLDRKK